MKWFGIDYGSKLAGTTAVSFLDGNDLIIVQSKKNQDADQLINELVEKHQPEHLFIDVPLSLPGVYKDDTAYHDYFYRACDRTLGAMSPMFLAGLTARGIKMCADFAKKRNRKSRKLSNSTCKVFVDRRMGTHPFRSRKNTEPILHSSTCQQTSSRLTFVLFGRT